jgi:hypothetical protein
MSCDNVATTTLRRRARSAWAARSDLTEVDAHYCHRRLDRVSGPRLASLAATAGTFAAVILWPRRRSRDFKGSTGSIPVSRTTVLHAQSVFLDSMPDRVDDMWTIG